MIHHVENGGINSVHVGLNFNQMLLNERIDLLWTVVTPGIIVDINLHLTLASGKHLVKKTLHINIPKSEYLECSISLTKHLHASDMFIKIVAF